MKKQLQVFGFCLLASACNDRKRTNVSAVTPGPAPTTTSQGDNNTAASTPSPAENEPVTEGGERKGLSKTGSSVDKAQAAQSAPESSTAAPVPTPAEPAAVDLQARIECKLKDTGALLRVDFGKPSILLVAGEEELVVLGEKKVNGEDYDLSRCDMSRGFTDISEDVPVGSRYLSYDCPLDDSESMNGWVSIKDQSGLFMVGSGEDEKRIDLKDCAPLPLAR